MRIVWWNMPESPRVMALRKKAPRYMLQVKVWGRYAKLCEPEGEGWIRLRLRALNTYGEVLSTPEYACWVRPTDPAKAVEFDRQSATGPADAGRCKSITNGSEEVGASGGPAVGECPARPRSAAVR